MMLFIVLLPGYSFSAPPPNLVGYWEGTGKFFDVNPDRPEELDVTVTLVITEQSGTRFKGVITAYWWFGVMQKAFVGGTPDIPVGGHVQGGILPSILSRTINMFGGWGYATDGTTQYVMEIDGQYRPRNRALRIEPSLTGRWRGIAPLTPTDRPESGKVSLGEFTVYKTELTPAY